RDPVISVAREPVVSVAREPADSLAPRSAAAGNSQAPPSSHSSETDAGAKVRRVLHAATRDLDGPAPAGNRVRLPIRAAPAAAASAFGRARQAAPRTGFGGTSTASGPHGHRGPGFAIVTPGLLAPQRARNAVRGFVIAPS